MRETYQRSMPMGNKDNVENCMRHKSKSWNGCSENSFPVENRQGSGSMVPESICQTSRAESTVETG